jgi:hypothetical protein
VEESERRSSVVATKWVVNGKVVTERAAKLYTDAKPKSAFVVTRKKKWGTLVIEVQDA